MNVAFDVANVFVCVFYVSVHVNLQDGLYVSSAERQSSSGYVWSDLFYLKSKKKSQLNKKELSQPPSVSLLKQNF